MLNYLNTSIMLRERSFTVIPTSTIKPENFVSVSASKRLRAIMLLKLTKSYSYHALFTKMTVIIFTSAIGGGIVIGHVCLFVGSLVGSLRSL